MLRNIPPSLSFLNLILCALTGALILHSTYALADQPSPAQDKETIRRVVKDFVSAWNDDEAHALVKLFVQNGVLKTPTDADAESRAAIRKLLTQDQEDLFQDSTLRKNIRSIQLQGADRATVEGRYQLDGIEPGLGLVKVSVQGKYTFFLEKHHGTWLIKKCDIRRSD